MILDTFSPLPLMLFPGILFLYHRIKEITLGMIAAAMITTPHTRTIPFVLILQAGRSRIFSGKKIIGPPIKIHKAINNKPFTDAPPFCLRIFVFDYIIYSKRVQETAGNSPSAPVMSVPMMPAPLMSMPAFLTLTFRSLFRLRRFGPLLFF